MLIIGLTGGSGAGKTFVASQWQTMGARLIDCDALYHVLLGENEALRSELAKRFPFAVNADGVDRARLRTIVFADEAALSDLNRITHKYVIAETRRLLELWRTDGAAAAVVEAIYLLESGLGDLCGVRVAVTAPREERLRRLLVRDGLSAEALNARLDAQQADAFYETGCDYTLTGGCMDELRERARALYRTLCDSSNCIY